jgi:hypothetical protein
MAVCLWVVPCQYFHLETVQKASSLLAVIELPVEGVAELSADLWAELTDLSCQYFDREVVQKVSSQLAAGALPVEGVAEPSADLLSA